MATVAVKEADAHAGFDPIGEPESHHFAVELLGPVQIRHEEHRVSQTAAAGYETGVRTSGAKRRWAHRQSPSQFMAKAERIDEPRQVGNRPLGEQLGTSLV